MDLNTPQSTKLQNKQIEADYDSRPYESNAHFYTAPGHIRAAAHLYGVETVPLARARVLELGCAAGGNLLPFALMYPEATVVGVDLSSVQVAQGQEVINDLGVKNMQLHAMSLTDITPAFGQFDYIVAHGVFSWVPPDVKTAILRICNENLSPQGIAYVSFNTYPGWKAGDVVRDAVLLASHGAQTEQERLGRAKAMFTVLTDGLAPGNGMGNALRALVEQLRSQSDYYLLHEHLALVNTPCYLVEFADAAVQAGLTYVGDSEPNTELAATYGPNVQLTQSVIALGQNKIMRQQFLDFAVSRSFRKALLVHGERGTTALPDLGRLRDLRFAAPFVAKPAQDGQPAGYTSRRQQFISGAEPGIEPLVKALGEAWPRSLGWEALDQALTERVADTQERQRVLSSAIQTLFAQGVLHLSLGDDPYEEAGAASLVPGFAYLARRNWEGPRGVGCFNAWHETLSLSLTPAQYWIVEELERGFELKRVAAELSQALQRGDVPGNDGVSRKGQRNLSALATNMVRELTLLLRRRGVVLGDA
ncbi:methyltransferase domain-containing protein [Bordetella avium]|nr:methyltransferase domain-containing protein [Bordetella avium]RIQ44779.1 methyltransferase domain-containing protein [Bordetella avium]RIQ45003.1 methyltransferase domain-containing protein [Bordetella avium]RIQ47632.1 methyltransferase domain-containing protein [Bordetella avium]RIQ63125.1 methyltransferase domain-containing protein [Bordetella avium]